MTIARRAQRPDTGAASTGLLGDGWTQEAVIAAALPYGERVTLARAFGVCLVSAWWRTLTAGDQNPQRLRSPPQAQDLVDVPRSLVELAERIGQSAAILGPERAAYEIGLAYTRMLPPEHRSEFGIYYTPPSLTSRLIDQATVAGVDWRCARVLDPACGGGAFLTPVARRIMNSLPGCSPAILLENIGNRLRGYEIDPFAAWLSQVSLDAVVLPLSRNGGRKLPVVIAVCDSLQRALPHERFDLVIGNPPYGRVRLDQAERARFKRSLYGHANLYGLFTDLALRHAKPDGVVAYVTPTSFLAGHYFKNLRALLASEAPPATIDFVAVRKGVFDDALQETLLATYRCGAPRGLATVHEVTPIDELTISIRDSGSISLPSDPSQPWLLPRTAIEASLVARLAHMENRLADWGYGVSTGPLVWNRFKDQLVYSSGSGRRPLIWAEAVTADGQFIFRAEKKNPCLSG